MLKRSSELRILFTVLALAALSAVTAAACAGEEAAPAAPQQPAAAAAADPAAAAPADPAMAAAAAAPAMAPTAAAMAAVRVAPEVLAGVESIAFPPAVLAVLADLGVELGQPGAAEGSPKMGGTIRVTGLEVKTFDQHLNNSYRLQLTNSYTHLRLLRYDQGPGKPPGNYDPVPALAESWDVEDGGKRIVFHLRKGVNWHDKAPVNGREVVASDWLWTWDRVNRIETAARQKDKLKDVDSWTSTDDYTLIANLKVPSAGFLSLITQPLMEVLAPEVEAA